VLQPLVTPVPANQATSSANTDSDVSPNDTDLVGVRRSWNVRRSSAAIVPRVTASFGQNRSGPHPVVTPAAAMAAMSPSKTELPRRRTDSRRSGTAQVETCEGSPPSPRG
jgi:hypothetical protein